MPIDPALSEEEFSFLREIGAGIMLGANTVSFTHLGTLLKLEFIKAELDSYAVTASGMLRITQGN